MAAKRVQICGETITRLAKLIKLILRGIHNVFGEES